MVLFTDAIGIGIYTAKWSPGLRTQRDVNILISTEISITPQLNITPDAKR